MSSANDEIKIERIKEMPQLKKEIISKLFDFVSGKKQNQWWQFTGEFEFDGAAYDLECKCMWDGVMFSYKEFHIAHKQIVIDIEDLMRTGRIQ
jgi:hypothetical protein